ncbi:MAG TPA: response regulator, partial [Variovorax sp.]|nr:response regulator [Variovorax sp.]
ELHGGTLEASSAGPDLGSEFTVRLCMPRLEAARGTEANGAGAAPVEQARRRVLVVDDNGDAADTLAQLLRLCGHETHTTHDGEDGIVAAERLQPDIILLDIGLPGLSGHDVCRRIRAQPWGAKVVIYAITGWGQPEDLQRSREAGFNGHLTKPVDLAELERVLAG